MIAKMESLRSYICSTCAMGTSRDTPSGWPSSRSRSGVASACRTPGWRCSSTRRDCTHLGKIGVPDRILAKNGPLDADEWAVMRCHPVWGAEVLAGVHGLEEVATVVRFHHERWDGRGYPDGLAGEEIPKESRIVGACDAFCSITADRPYRAALGCEQALGLLGAAGGATKKGQRKVGQQFDPAVVEVLTAAVEERPELAGTDATGRARRRGPVTNGAARGARREQVGLVKAIAAVGDLPALAESRQRLLRLLDVTDPPSGRIADVIEADPGLTASVLRAGTPGNDAPRSPADVPAAVRALGIEGLRGIAESVRVFDFFQQVAAYRIAPERFRLHAVATRRAASRITTALQLDSPDALAAAALLHDVGKLVLAEADDGYPDRIHGDARTPQDRVKAERNALGTDHAAVGGHVLRAWGLPGRICAAVAAHHDIDTGGDAAVIGVAHMLAHYASGTPVDPSDLLRLARAVELAPELCPP